MDKNRSKYYHCCLSHKHEHTDSIERSVLSMWSTFPYFHDVIQEPGASFSFDLVFCLCLCNVMLNRNVLAKCSQKNLQSNEVDYETLNTYFTLAFFHHHRHRPHSTQYLCASSRILVCVCGAVNFQPIAINQFSLFSRSTFKSTSHFLSESLIDKASKRYLSTDSRYSPKRDSKHFRSQHKIYFERKKYNKFARG